MHLTKTWLAQLPLTDIQQVQPVSGGDINAAFQIITRHHQYFLKVQPHNDVTFFDHEVAGLRLLGAVTKTPRVIASGTIATDGYLLLDCQ
ncbi:hypothetical protein WP50_24430 [Lactiplantibacillus plantarum]|nr:hypothetical protein WP50_24430 [Lactiplantibacillus plantarum]